MKKEIPIWEKSNLTIEEAAAYSVLERIVCVNLLVRILVLLYCGWEKRGLLSGKNLMSLQKILFHYRQ